MLPKAIDSDTHQSICLGNMSINYVTAKIWGALSKMQCGSRNKKTDDLVISDHITKSLGYWLKIDMYMEGGGISVRCNID